MVQQPRNEAGLPQGHLEAPGRRSDKQKEQPVAALQSETESSHSPPLRRTPTAPPQTTAVSRTAFFGQERHGSHGRPVQLLQEVEPKPGSKFAKDTDHSQPLSSMLQKAPRAAPASDASCSRSPEHDGPGPQRILTATPGHAKKPAGTLSGHSKSRKYSIITATNPEREMNYKSVVVNLSGQRDSHEMHIATQELVGKLTDFMMKQNKWRTEDDKRAWGLRRPEWIFNITGTAAPSSSSVEDFIQLWDEDDAGESTEAAEKDAEESAKSSVQRSDDPIDAFKKDWPQLWFYKRLKDYITEVIFGIADRKRSCWIMDGGTNAGIMKLLGAMHKEHFQCSEVLHRPEEFPLIGFSDLGILKRDSFPEFSCFDKDTRVESPHGDIQIFRHMQENFKGQHKPDDDHTHHVFVHTKGFKCKSLRDKENQAHEHHFLLRQYVHFAKEFDDCPIVRLIAEQ
jgi:hypothetical protein